MDSKRYGGENVRDEIANLREDIRFYEGLVGEYSDMAGDLKRAALLELHIASTMKKMSAIIVAFRKRRRRGVRELSPFRESLQLKNFCSGSLRMRR